MIIKRYMLYAGRMHEKPVSESQPLALPVEGKDYWCDVQEADPEELRKFLTPLNLHPLQMKRCLDSVNDPGVISFGKSLLMEYPATFAPESPNPAFITILLHNPVLVTVRHG